MISKELWMSMNTDNGRFIGIGLIEQYCRNIII
jgi:hypothetical protein